MKDQIDALTDFCVDNPELEQLEASLAEFNLFEAAGLTKHEIRHSRFLSFLLDPQGGHGLGDLFATRLLQAAVQGRSPDEFGLSALDLELMDLSDLQVSCESYNIDLLLLSARNRFAVVIENKIKSGEHSNQLERYRQAVEIMKPGWRILPLLLSPLGFEPSDPKYFPISYEMVSEILSTTLQNRRASLGPDVAIALHHYERLLRRNIVSDSKLTELCKQIVSKHRKALELLIEHMDDPRNLTLEAFDRLMSEEGFEKSKKRWLPCGWLEWVPRSSKAESGFILGFRVDLRESKHRLILDILPGPPEIRTALYESFRGSEHFVSGRKAMTDQWTKISEWILATEIHTEDGTAEWENQVRTKLQDLKRTVLPHIEQQLRQAIPK